MLQIGNTIISLDLINKSFSCDLNLCQGKCCVLGDSGAPFEKEEIEIIESLLHQIKPYMSDNGLNALNKKGFYTVDNSNEMVTELVDGKECVFAFFENGIAKCAIEKANENHNTGFLKPMSCHLYPVRIQKYNSFIAVNFNKWEVCTPAHKNGEERGIPIYRFLKQALIRRFGENWYNELSLAADSLIKK